MARARLTVSPDEYALFNSWKALYLQLLASGYYHLPAMFTLARLTGARRLEAYFGMCLCVCCVFFFFSFLFLFCFLFIV
jgi:hypothetical protein